MTALTVSKDAREREHFPVAPLPKRFNAAELMAAEFPEPRWAVPGIIPEGLTVLAGRPKLGKSWLVWNIAVAVASGGVALGKHPVESGDVLMLALEDSPRRLQNRLGQMLGTETAPEHLEVWTASERLDQGGLGGIADWLGEHPEARLIVIDTWGRIRPKADTRSSTLYAIDYEPVAQLQGLAAAAGCAVVLVWHTRKAAATDWIDEISGTTGLTAAADALLAMKRDRGTADAFLMGTGRDFEDYELALAFDSDRGLWIDEGEGMIARLGGTRRTLYELLREEGPMTPKAAAEASGLVHSTVRQSLSRMVTDGQLIAHAGIYDLPAGDSA